MRKEILISLICLWPFCSWSATPQDSLNDAIVLLAVDRNWNNELIGSKLRNIRTTYPQTSEALSATALLAFQLTQIPGDHQEEIFALCDEVAAKAPKSWQAWVANLARIASWGLRDGENNKTLSAALMALDQTDGAELSQHPDIALKSIMDKWPPAPADFTDQIHAVISQQALILGKQELAIKHLDSIVSPRLKSQGERRIARYLPERSKAQGNGKVNDASEIDKAKSVSASAVSLPSPKAGNEVRSAEPKPASTTPNEEPTSSTPWRIIVVLIVAATGLLWLLVKKRK